MNGPFLPEPRCESYWGAENRYVFLDLKDRCLTHDRPYAECVAEAFADRDRYREALGKLDEALSLDHNGRYVGDGEEVEHAFNHANTRQG